MSPYHDSSLYQLGLLHAELGRLLLDPATTLDDLAAFGQRHDLNVAVRLAPVAAAPTDGQTPGDGHAA